jgi:hypothetical protein
VSRNVDRDDLYVEVPRRFHDATRRGEVNGRQYLLGCYLAGEVHFQTGEVSLTLRALADGCDWQWSDDTLVNDLKPLRPAWIDFKISQGQRRPYVFRLTGLRRRKVQQLPQDFRPETPSPAEVTSRLRKSEQAAKPQPESGSALAQLPHGGSPKEEKRREETKAGNEEKLDQVEGETTAAEFDAAAFIREQREHDPTERVRRFDEMFPPPRGRPS